MKFQLNQLVQNIGLRILGLLVGVVIVEIGLNLAPEEALSLLITRYQSRIQLYQTDPKIGWQHKPNATIRYTSKGEYDVQAQFNSLGLNDFEHAYDKHQAHFVF